MTKLLRSRRGAGARRGRARAGSGTPLARKARDGGTLTLLRGQDAKFSGTIPRTKDSKTGTVR